MMGSFRDMRRLQDVALANAIDIDWEMQSPQLEFLWAYTDVTKLVSQ